MLLRLLLLPLQQLLHVPCLKGQRIKRRIHYINHLLQQQLLQQGRVVLQLLPPQRAPAAQPIPICPVQKQGFGPFPCSICWCCFRSICFYA